MADTAINIGGLDDGGALLDTDLLEIERPGTPSTGKRVAGSALRRPWPTVEITTTAATLALTHASTWLKCNNASAQTITIPAEATVAWPADTEMQGFQYGAGAVTFVGASGVTIRKHSSLTLAALGRYAPFGLKKIGTNEWLLFGMMGSA